MENYWKQVCAWKAIWQALFVMCSVALVMVGMSLIITPQGTAADYVNQFNVALLVPTTVGTLYVLVRCRRKKR